MSKLCDDFIHCSCSDRIEELEAKLIKTAKGLADEIRRADAAEAKIRTFEDVSECTWIRMNP